MRAALQVCTRFAARRGSSAAQRPATAAAADAAGFHQMERIAHGH
jgi:hypothetical protein